jgi:REP element-mobilizing transposase RayT
MDRLLDTATTGPFSLRRPEIAALVVAALRKGETDWRSYQLHAYVVMPNHVHLLVTPHGIATRWLGPLKGFTAHEANRSLGTTGAEEAHHARGNSQGSRSRRRGDQRIGARWRSNWRKLEAQKRRRKGA